MRNGKRCVAAALCCALAASLAGCGPKETPKPTGPPEEETKTMLMFEIDEGIAGTGPILENADNYSKMSEYLGNICDALGPLRAKFDVSVQIYPTWFYRESGYGGDASKPLERIAPEFLYALNYLVSRDMPFYLEIHSSGIRTNQNGELGNLAPAPLHYGEEEKCRSLPMDMEALSALKAEYGDYFLGVRFHELIGSHQIGLNDRAAGREESSHAWVVQERVVKGIIDTCRETGLELVWSDHSWNQVYENEASPQIGCFKDWLNYAVQRMPEGKLTLKWANNSWDIHQYIYGGFGYKGYGGTRAGMSVQDWFWQEMDCSTLQYEENGVWQTKWYVDADLDCPPELMAAFTLNALENGYTLVQFEPPQYFFNMNVPRVGGQSAEAASEGKPDYTAKLALKRFIDYILHPEAEYAPSPDLKSYFDEDERKFKENYEGDPAKRYYQTILTMVGSEQDGLRVYDRYNNDLTKWTEYSENRYREGIFTGDTELAGRINLTFSCIDEYMVVKRRGTRRILEFYNYRNGRISTVEGILDDNAAGEVVAVTALNLISERVQSMDGDADEILVTRRNGDTYSHEIYKAKSVGSAVQQRVTFERVANDAALVAACIPPGGLFGELLNVLPVRTRNAVLASSLRPTDAGCLAVARSADGIRLTGVLEGKAVSRDIAFSGEAICCTTADIDGDFRDELCVVVGEGGATRMLFVDLEEFALINGEELDLGGFTPRFLFSTRVGMYAKAYRR